MAWLSDPELLLSVDVALGLYQVLGIVPLEEFELGSGGLT